MKVLNAIDRTSIVPTYIPITLLSVVGISRPIGTRPTTDCKISTSSRFGFLKKQNILTIFRVVKHDRITLYYTDGFKILLRTISSLTFSPFNSLLVFVQIVKRTRFSIRKSGRFLSFITIRRKLVNEVRKLSKNFSS